MPDKIKNVVAFADEVLGIQLYPLQVIALLGIASHVMSVWPCGRRPWKWITTTNVPVDRGGWKSAIPVLQSWALRARS